jgi:hypothetical protein
MCNSSRQIFQEKRMLCAGLTSLEYLLHPFPYCIIELSCRELLHRRTNGRFKLQASLSPRSFPRRVKHNCPGVRINKELNTELPWCEMLIVTYRRRPCILQKRSVFVDAYLSYPSDTFVEYLDARDSLIAGASCCSDTSQSLATWLCSCNHAVNDLFSWMDHQTFPSSKELKGCITSETSFDRFIQQPEVSATFCFVKRSISAFDYT